MPSFNTDPNNFVDLNNYFSEINDKVGLSSEQFKLLVENTYYLLNHLGLADVEVGTITTQYGEPGTLADVLVTHREETVGGQTTDYFDYVFTIPSAEVTASASATTASGSESTVTTTTTPIKNNNVTVGYNINFDFEIPRGPKGDPGERGLPGDPGPKGDPGNTTVFVNNTEMSTIDFDSDPQTQIDAKLNKNLGVGNAGKILKVDAQGEIVATQSSAENDVIDAYIVGQAYTSGWLSETIGGQALEPQAGKLYIIKTQGDDYLKQYVWQINTYAQTGGEGIEDGSVTYQKLSTELQSSIDDIDNKVDKVAGKGLSTNDYTTEEKQKLAGIVVPTKTSDLTNDSGFITKAVADLANYYLKNETYTKTEIGNLISAIPKFSIKVVNALPVTDISDTTVYLVRNTGSETQNLYDEYIYVNDGTEQSPDWKWEKLGSQTLDLSGYVQTSRKINNKALTSDITLNASDVGALPSNTTFVSSVNGSSGAITDIATTSDLNNHYTKTQTDALLSGKQATIDSSHKLDADLIQDGTTNKTVTATEKSAWDSKYTKPSGGIPKTDLASAVQTSLGLADSAVQDGDLATVATSGSYNDLTDKPTIPSGVVVDNALSSTSENPVQNKVITAKFAQLGYFPNLSADVFDIGQGGTTDLEFRTVTHAGTNETISWQYFKGGQSYSGYFGDIVNAVNNYNNAGNAGYADKIVSKQTGTGSGYITFASGLKICWGTTNKLSDNAFIYVGFPISFNTTPVVAMSSAYGKNDGAWAGAYNMEYGNTGSSLSTNGFNLFTRGSSSSNGRVVYWVAIGF